MTLRVSKSSMNCWSKARTFRPANRRYSSMVEVSDQRCTFRSVPTKQPVRCLPCTNMQSQAELTRVQKERRETDRGVLVASVGAGTWHSNRTFKVSPPRAHETTHDGQEERPTSTTRQRWAKEQEPRDEPCCSGSKLDGSARLATLAMHPEWPACARQERHHISVPSKTHQHTHAALDQQPVSPTSTHARGPLSHKHEYTKEILLRRALAYRGHNSR